MQEKTNKALASQTPQRRCISCRSNGKKSSLLRFVAFEGVLCFDCRKKAPGRGYYVCAQEFCLNKAWNGGFKRASKGALAVEGDLKDYIQETILPGLWKRYHECLLVGRQNQSLIVSTEAVESAAREDKLASYVLAIDASHGTKRKYFSNAQRKGLKCMGLLDKESLSKLLGKSNKSVLGWLEGLAFDEFFEIEQSIIRLSGASSPCLELGDADEGDTD